jgi:hypothetical protein
VMEIRTFAEADRTELRELFGRAGEGAPSASLWGHEESEAAVYLYPYVDLQPDSLFVAVVDGALVGYLAGCLDCSRQGCARGSDSRCGGTVYSVAPYCASRCCPVVCLAVIRHPCRYVGQARLSLYR